MERKFYKCMLAATVPAALLIGASVAQADELIKHPEPQPLPEGKEQFLLDEGTTRLIGAEGIFPEQDPWLPADGENEVKPTNLLDNVYENLIDGFGNEIPHTLPSTPENPYNLHPDPEVSEVDPRDPVHDLRNIFQDLNEAVENGGTIDFDQIQFAVDILEGNEIDRTYSGFPLLHYNGPLKEKVVEPEYDEDGNVVGGNVNVHQLWMRSHLESDTGFIDPSAVQDVPWTITYTIDVLEGGEEDFAPHAMFMNLKPDENGEKTKGPGFGLDQTFFPMDEGKRYVFEMKMPEAKRWKLTYHWGWRVHPAKVQVIENSLQKPMGKYLMDWERDVFGENPRESEEAKLEAISMISDLAPAKRMWRAFRAILDGQPESDANAFKKQIAEAESAFDDWQNRNYMPEGIEPDPDADVTLFYANNQIYGEVKGFTRETPDMQRSVDKWRTRGTDVDVRIINGDYYPRAYVNVDFGGMRGWENTFQNTIPVGGQGPWFTFGRTHWWPNTAHPVLIAAAERPDGVPTAGFPAEPAEDDTSDNAHVFTPHFERHPGDDNLPGEVRTEDGFGTHLVKITYNHEPSRRLRFYQFDPLHHDVAVWSVH